MIEFMRIVVTLLYFIVAMLYSYPERWLHHIKYKGTKAEHDANFYCLKRLSKNILKLLGVKLEVHGCTKYDEAVIYIGNHRSNFDSLILIAVMERPLMFVGKNEIKKFPFVGRWFQDIGCLFLERDNLKKSLEVIRQGAERVKQGYSLVIFPEGGRTKEDCVREFKSGSFKLATKTQACIVPVTFHNSEECYERHHWFYPANVKVDIGEVVDPTKLGLKNTVQLAEYLHGVISQTYNMR